MFVTFKRKATLGKRSAGHGPETGQRKLPAGFGNEKRVRLQDDRTPQKGRVATRAWEKSHS